MYHGQVPRSSGASEGRALQADGDGPAAGVRRRDRDDAPRPDRRGARRRPPDPDRLARAAAGAGGAGRALPLPRLPGAALRRAPCKDSGRYGFADSGRARPRIFADRDARKRQRSRRRHSGTRMRSTTSRRAAKAAYHAGPRARTARREGCGSAAGGWLAIFFRPARIFLLTARFKAGGLGCGPASGMPLGRPWPFAGGLPAPGKTTKPHRGPIGPPGAVQVIEKQGVMMDSCLSSPAPFPLIPSRLPRRPLRLPRPRSRPCSLRHPTRPRPTSRRSATG